MNKLPREQLTQIPRFQPSCLYFYSANGKTPLFLGHRKNL